MIDSTTDERESSSHRKPKPGFRDLFYDLISLAELQGSLLKTDVGQIKTGSAVPLAMIICGVVLAFATAPVLLLTIGWSLVEFAEMPLWAAMATSIFIGGLLPSGLLLFFGWKLLTKKTAVLKRSSQELSENCRWLKHRLQSSF